MTAAEFISLVVQLVLVPLVIWGLTIIKKEIYKKIESEEVKQALALAVEAVQAAVGEAGQTYADTIKADQGSLTTEQQRIAFEMAFRKAQVILGDRGTSLLKKVTGDANAYITAKIEEEVRKTRKEFQPVIEDDIGGFGMTD